MDYIHEINSGHCKLFFQFTRHFRLQWIKSKSFHYVRNLCSKRFRTYSRSSYIVLGEDGFRIGSRFDFGGGEGEFPVAMRSCKCQVLLEQVRKQTSLVHILLGIPLGPGGFAVLVRSKPEQTWSAPLGNLAPSTPTPFHLCAQLNE